MNIDPNKAVEFSVGFIVHNTAGYYDAIRQKFGDDNVPGPEFQLDKFEPKNYPACVQFVWHSGGRLAGVNSCPLEAMHAEFNRNLNILTQHLGVPYVTKH